MKQLFPNWAKKNSLPMIILNLTPDSFSDGGLLLEENKFQAKLQNLELNNFLLVDIGVQSTAPHSKAISGAEEKERLEEYFFAKLNTAFFKQTLLIFSLDTYRSETIFWFNEKLRKNGYKNQLIWNDVSGIMDETVSEFLLDSKHLYICCHNRVQKREESPNHMDFTPSEFDFEEMFHFFKKVEGRDQIIFDPCFGFAKSYEENIFWLKELPRLVDLLKNTNPFLVGISRKSFLRKMAKEKISDSLNTKFDEYSFSEVLHLEYLKSFQQNIRDRELIFRIHDPLLFNFL